MTWDKMPLAGFDLETTGVDTDTARPVSMAIVVYDPDGEVYDKATSLINPGIPIPPEATEIHGITDAMVVDAMPVSDALVHILENIDRCAKYDIPLVGMNLAYDLSLVNKCTNGFLYAVRVPWVLDLYVIDKHVDRYRKGSRKLSSLCEIYGVEHEGAHDATNDVVASIKCLLALAKKYPYIASMPPWLLHKQQIAWFKEQTDSLSEYFLANDKPSIPEAKRKWPLYG